MFHNILICALTEEWFKTILVVVEHLVTPVNRLVIRSLEAEIIEFIIHVWKGE